jgi:hypothetical protein
MSPIEPPVPPAGEELHIPEGSIQPFLLALFLTITLVGVTFSIFLVIFGGIASLWVIVRWIRDARHELHDLPVHSDQH